MWQPQFGSVLSQNLLMSFFRPEDATHKFDQDWPTCIRDVIVWTTGDKRTTEQAILKAHLVPQVVRKKERLQKTNVNQAAHMIRNGFSWLYGFLRYCM